MKFLDLFSGIGGFREGLTRAGFEPVGWCEIDKHAKEAYRLIHKPEGEYFNNDVTTIKPDELPAFDLICGGFPCQSFSIAGKRGGFDDTRGTLFFEIMRIAKARKPKYILLENVRGLLSHDGGQTFGTILAAMGECGYDVQYQVLNSKDFGVPQNRQRVFIVGHLRGLPRPEVFPFTGQSGNAINKVGNLNEKGRHESAQRVYSPDGIGPALNTVGGGGLQTKIIQPVLTPDRAEKRQNGRRFKEAGEPSFTLTAQDRHGIMIKSATNELCEVMADFVFGGHTYSIIEGFSCDISDETMRYIYEYGNNSCDCNRADMIAEQEDPDFPEMECGELIKMENFRIVRGLDKRTRHPLIIGKNGAEKLDQDTASCLTAGGHSGGNHSDMDLLVGGIPDFITKPNEINNTLRTGGKGSLTAGKGSLTAKHNWDTIYDGVTIRRLTPLECFRLQGFPDSWYHTLRVAGVSDTQMYKRAGNAVTVNVVQSIAERLMESIRKDHNETH